MHPSYDIGYYRALEQLGLTKVAEAHLEKCAADAGMTKEAFRRQLMSFLSQLGGKGAIVKGTEAAAKPSSGMLSNVKNIFSGKGRNVNLPSAGPTQSMASKGFSPTRSVAPTAPTMTGAPAGQKPGMLQRAKDYFGRGSGPATTPTPGKVTNMSAQGAGPKPPSANAAGQAENAFAGRPAPAAPGAKDYAALEQGMLNPGATGATPGAKPWTLGRKLKWGAGLGLGGAASYHLLGEQGPQAQQQPQQQYSNPYSQGGYY